MFEFSKLMDDPRRLLKWKRWFESKGIKCEIREQIFRYTEDSPVRIKYSLWRGGEEAIERGGRAYRRRLNRLGQIKLDDINEMGLPVIIGE